MALTVSRSLQTILLIEGDPDDRNLLSTMLHSMGNGDVRVICADELAAGLIVLVKTPPDAIVSDLHLPDSSGLDIVTAIHQQSPMVPLVVLNGAEQEELAVQALQCGAQDYLCKAVVDSASLRRSLRYAVERKRADTSLLCQKCITARLVECVEAIVLQIDAKGRLLRMNRFATTRTGIDARAAVGDDWRNVLIPESERPAMDEFLGAIVSSKKTKFSNSHVTTRNDTLFKVRWAGRAMRSGKGRIEHVILTGHDISELEDAQQRALQAERLAAIGRTMIGLAHESRNALQRSQACLSLLDRVSHGNSQALDYIARLQRAQDDLRRIYDGLRDYGQSMRLDLQTWNLRDVVEETWSDLAKDREGRDVSLETEANDCDLVCQVDRFSVQQVFRNLFDNSLTACRDPVKILVQWNDVWHNELPAIQVTVLDNGPGFTPEQANQAFDVFFTSKLNGNGLGLPIAKRIVEAHGGEMHLLREPRDGAAIAFTLPKGEGSNHSPTRRGE